MHERVKVLFVCMGNICRSPTAEGVFRHHVREAGLEHLGAGLGEVGQHRVEAGHEQVGVEARRDAGEHRRQAGDRVSADRQDSLPRGAQNSSHHFSISSKII